MSAAADRVTVNEPDNWCGPDYALGHVDEIVLTGTCHFEMSTHSSGYLHVWSDQRRVFARVYARPTTRVERRQILARDQDRLADHLRALIPSPRTIWAVPPWRRPWAAVSSWWEVRRSAAAALCVVVEEDEETP